MPTSSSQNTTVYSPYIVLQQSPSRVAINLLNTDGITFVGLTLGDVIRYDAINGGYTLAIATSEANAEVLGVVESISTTSCTVVTSGSIKYPSVRLSGITYGGDGGVDILYLDETVRGGLTGAVIVGLTSGQKIVKPVIQVAPHGQYNGIVVNYPGYKSWYTPSTAEEGVVLAPGAIVFAVNSVSPGPNWLNVSNDLTVSVTAYPNLYSIYANKTDFIETTKISYGAISSALIGKEAYQLGGLNNTTKINTGTVVDVNLSSGSLDIKKLVGTSQMDPAKILYITTDTNPFSISNSSISKIIIPAVSSGNLPSQNGVTLAPYIKAYESIKTFIPSTLKIDKLVVDTIAQIGTVTDVQQKFNTIDSKLNAINARLGGGLF